MDLLGNVFLILLISSLIWLKVVSDTAGSRNIKLVHVTIIKTSVVELVIIQ